MAEPSRRCWQPSDHRQASRTSDRLDVRLAVGAAGGGGRLRGVGARYLFNAPTIWAFDLTYMLYGSLFMLGAAYALHKGAHIRTDFFWEKFSIRTKGLIDTISYIVFFFPSSTVLLLISWHEAELRLADQRDVGPDAVAAGPVAVQGGVPLACLLLLIQGFSGAAEEPLHGAHRRRARAQREGRDMTGKHSSA